MSVEEVLIDRIYEAASVPERWPDVLETLAAVAGGQAGALVAYRGHEPIGHTSSPRYREGYDDYFRTGRDLLNVRPQRARDRQYPGFIADIELQTPEELAGDAIYQRFLHPHGLQWTAGTLVFSPSDDLLVVDIARVRGQPPFERAALDALNVYRPHIARAALLSSRLGLRAAATAGPSSRGG